MRLAYASLRKDPDNVDAWVMFTAAQKALAGNFEEVAYLLLHGELPGATDLQAFSSRVHAAARSLDPAVTDALRRLAAACPQAAPMDALRTGVSIDTEGFVVASYSNGATQKLWKIPVATFASPNELQARNGSAYGQTTASGEFTLREANKGGAGRIEPLSLEGSNVDLSEEFSQMITTSGS